MPTNTDTERLDWMYDHYAKFVSGRSASRKGGGWDHSTEIEWTSFANDFEDGDPADDGNRRGVFAGEFREALDACMLADEAETAAAEAGTWTLPQYPRLTNSS